MRDLDKLGQLNATVEPVETTPRDLDKLGQRRVVVAR